MISDVPTLITFGINILNGYIVPAVFAVAFIVFIVGVYRYFIFHGGDSEHREEGRKFVLWSIIGFVVMFSLWGLINLFTNTLGFNSATRPDLPTFAAPTNNTITNTNTTNYVAPTGTYTSGGGGSTNFNPTNTVTSSSNCGSFDTATGAYGTVCSTGYSCVNNACVLNAGVDPNSLTAQCGSFNDYDCPNGESCNSNGMCDATTNTPTATTGQQCTDGTVAPVGGSCYNCGSVGVGGATVTTANGADCPAGTYHELCDDGARTTTGCITCNSGNSVAVASNCYENGGTY